MRATAVVVVLLVSCVHVGHRDFTGSDGRVSYEAYCNGSNVSFADCMNEAAETAWLTGIATQNSASAQPLAPPASEVPPKPRSRTP